MIRASKDLPPMREHHVYDALRRYLDAAVRASLAKPGEKARLRAELTEARLAYTNALEAYQLDLASRSQRCLHVVRNGTDE
jgi:hypothetical protein